MLAAPLRLAALLGLLSLTACQEPEQVVAPSALTGATSSLRGR